jgi:hypothetical protein
MIMFDYKTALEMNESKNGIDWDEVSLDELIQMIGEIPGWDYPLAEDSMNEMSRRAGIDPKVFFDNGDRDYNDLYTACAEALGVD